MTRGRALVCAPMLPEFDKESGSRRILDLMEFLTDGDWAVTFLARDADSDNRYVRLLQQRGIPAFVARDTDVVELIRHGRFDVALIFFWYIAEWLMPVIRKVSPTTRVVVDTVDLHYVRVARKVFGEGRAERVVKSLDPSCADEMAREISTYAAADGVLTVSRKEADTVNDLTGEPGLATAVTDCESLRPSPLGFEGRRGVVFMANFRHPPNQQAAEFFCTEILPKLDHPALQDGSIGIVGNALPASLAAFAGDDPRLRLVGWVPSVLPYIAAARVSLAPLLYGAGTKRKMVQSLMLGTPCVSTSIGAEGLDLEHGKNVLIADDPAAFADAVQSLLEDERLWRRLRRNGLRHIKRLHGRDASRAAFVQALEHVLMQRPKRGAAPEVAPVASHEYRDIKAHVKDAAMAHVPPRSTVLVISKGDDELVDLPGRTAWHFPQAEDGRYAGYHPKHSGQAIEHLEHLRVEGASHLLIPRPSFWWLDYYAGFGDHLEACYLPEFRDESCIIYGLSGRLDEQAPDVGTPEGAGGEAQGDKGPVDARDGAAAALSAESSPDGGDGSAPGSAGEASPDERGEEATGSLGEKVGTP